ncbi:hypothetical protein, partial [Streptomyces afghaniensis]|uniref:hypothetical protein n=1 Tax=Streptomyces afghaniensis TaxID=66865 RepID=UPI0037B2DE34
DPRPRLTFPHDPTNEQTSRRSLDQQLLLGPLNKLSPNHERRCQTAADQQDDQYSTRCAARIIRRAAQAEGKNSHDQCHDGGNTKSA